MKTAKLGAIFLISIMALAGVGAGYAAWFDTITITGTVNTGDVDLEIVRLSETFVYKDLDNDDIVITHKYTNVGPLAGGFGAHQWQTPSPPSNGLLVASATATATNPADDEIVVTFDNLFPCIEFYVDILLHYDGSIPVKVNFADFASIDDDTGLLALLWNLGYIWVEAYRANDDGTRYIDNSNPNGIIVDLGTQLHHCNYVILYLYIHLPQYWPADAPAELAGLPTDNLMNVDGGFTAQIEVVQWNEFPYTHPVIP